MKPDVQGKLVIISIFGVAIAMSIYAWWHNIHTGNQVIEFFGVENATRLRHADSIDLLILDADAQGQVNERFNTSAGPRISTEGKSKAIPSAVIDPVNPEIFALEVSNGPVSFIRH